MGAREADSPRNDNKKDNGKNEKRIPSGNDKGRGGGWNWGLGGSGMVGTSGFEPLTSTVSR